MSRAQKALKKCEEVHDQITLSKLLKGTEGHADRLTNELSQLNPDISEADKKPAQQIKKLSEDLIKLGKGIQESLAKSHPAP
jgi:hypothetical protein